MCNLDWWALFRTHCLSAVSDREYCSHVETTTYINTYHPICFTPEVAQTVQSSNVAKTLINARLSVVTCANLKIEVLNLNHPYMARLRWLFIHILILWWS